MNPIQVWNADLVTIKKYQSSFVALYSEDSLIGKIQVKFNNGIVERGTQNNYDHFIDGIYMKNGQPFSSWNFGLNV